MADYGIKGYNQASQLSSENANATNRGNWINKNINNAIQTALDLYDNKQKQEMADLKNKHDQDKKLHPEKYKDKIITENAFNQNSQNIINNYTTNETFKSMGKDLQNQVLEYTKHYYTTLQSNENAYKTSKEIKDNYQNGLNTLLKTYQKDNKLSYEQVKNINDMGNRLNDINDLQGILYNHADYAGVKNTINAIRDNDSMDDVTKNHTESRVIDEAYKRGYIQKEDMLNLRKSMLSNHTKEFVLNIAKKLKSSKDGVHALQEIENQIKNKPEFIDSLGAVPSDSDYVLKEFQTNLKKFDYTDKMDKLAESQSKIHDNYGDHSERIFGVDPLSTSHSYNDTLKLSMDSEHKADTFTGLQSDIKTSLNGREQTPEEMAETLNLRRADQSNLFTSYQKSKINQLTPVERGSYIQAYLKTQGMDSDFNKNSLIDRTIVKMGGEIPIIENFRSQVDFISKGRNAMSKGYINGNSSTVTTYLNSSQGGKFFSDEKGVKALSDLMQLNKDAGRDYINKAMMQDFTTVVSEGAYELAIKQNDDNMFKNVKVDPTNHELTPEQLKYALDKLSGDKLENIQSKFNAVMKFYSHYKTTNLTTDGNGGHVLSFGGFDGFSDDGIDAIQDKLYDEGAYVVTGKKVVNGKTQIFKKKINAKDRLRVVYRTDGKSFVLLQGNTPILNKNGDKLFKISDYSDFETNDEHVSFFNKVTKKLDTALNLVDEKIEQFGNWIEPNSLKNFSTTLKNEKGKQEFEKQKENQGLKFKYNPYHMGNF